MEYLVASVTMPTIVCVSLLVTSISVSLSSKVKGDGIFGSVLAEGKVVLEVEEPVDVVASVPFSAEASDSLVSGVPESCCASEFSGLSVFSCVSGFSAAFSVVPDAPHPLKAMQPVRRNASSFLELLFIGQIPSFLQ